VSQYIDRKIIRLQERIREAQKPPSILGSYYVRDEDIPDIARALLSKQMLSAVALTLLIPVSYVLKKTFLRHFVD